MRNPLEVFAEVIASVWTRAMAYILAMLLPSFIAFGPIDGWGRFGGLVMISCFTTYLGLPVYLGLMLLWWAYIRTELTNWVLLVPLLACTIDALRLQLY